MHIATELDVSSAKAAPLQGVKPPGKDDVSKAAASGLAQYAEWCREMMAEASKILRWYGRSLQDSADAYQDTDARNSEAIHELN